MKETSSQSAKFSIIVPTYNSAATITYTLQSIRDQKWSDTEVIIIDGASQDQTVKIAKSFNDLDIFVISEPDKGIYDAINKGIHYSSGDLICIIGSDDRLVAGGFSAVSVAWCTKRSDIIAGEALLVSPDGSSSKRSDEPYGLGALVSGIPFCHNSMYVTRETYQKVGDYSLKYRICADAEWVHRSIRAGCSCTRVAMPLVQFSLCGISSRSEDLIMLETYTLVAANFPGLSLSEAEILFKAVRRWTDGSQVAAVLEKHQSNRALLEAVAAGLHPVNSGAAGEPPGAISLHTKNLFTENKLRKIYQHLRSRFVGN